VELEDDLRKELIANFEDLYFEAESCLCRLEKNYDSRLVNELFRAIHTIKGNASMVHAQLIVDYTHQVENVISCCREESLMISPQLCEALQVGIDRLKDLHQQEILDIPFANVDFTALGAQFAALSQCGDEGATRWISAILGVAPEDLDKPLNENPGKKPAMFTGDASNMDPIKNDLLFFQELSLQIDNQSQYWAGRSIQLFDWTQKLNFHGGEPVSYEQLAAASYMHDIGMTFIPNEVLNKKGKLNEEELQQITLHSYWGYNILRRMQGWSEAAEIVLQHHEHENGMGYPDGLKEDEIHIGAKIIAIIDAFFSMTNGRADRSNRRSALRAIAEINARKHTQFNAFWVDRFNQMIKVEIRDGSL